MIGEPPMGPQPAGVHPAPERPGTSVNHRLTPATATTAGTPAQSAALRIDFASLRVPRESFPRGCAADSEGAQEEKVHLAGLVHVLISNRQARISEALRRMFSQ